MELQNVGFRPAIQQLVLPVRLLRAFVMDIAFLTRQSEFLRPCEDVIGCSREALETGGIVRIDLDKEGGYAGRILVTIRSNDPVYFGTNWEATDPTRFPARIKAAATALLNCGCLGRYEIIHKDGHLEIRTA